MSEQATVRIDKWLWAARFYKTRALASEAVSGGKVHVNAQRVKAARTLKLDDVISIVKGSVHWEVVVVGLSERRGPASQAQQLYRETASSLQAREEGAAQRRAERITAPRHDHRPNKRERRQLSRLRGRS